MIRVRRAALAALLSSALCAGACDDTLTAPTTPTTPITVIFASQLLKGGFAWRSFTVNTGGTVTVHLVSLLPEASLVVRLGVGTFDGTSCSITTSLDTVGGSADPQVSTTLSAGSYCVQVTDIGNLTRANDFTINVVIPRGA